MLTFLLVSCWSTSTPATRTYHFDSFEPMVRQAAQSQIATSKELASQLTFGQDLAGTDFEAKLGGATGYVMTAKNVDDVATGIETMLEVCTHCHQQQQVVLPHIMQEDHISPLTNAMNQALVDEKKSKLLIDAIFACAGCHQPQGTTGPMP